MHEHGITNEVVHQIVHACEDKGITCPKKIIVELGLLTTYKKDPVLFYFEAHKKNISLLKDATLEIIEVQGKIKCKDCGEINIVDPSPLLLCPICDSANVEIIDGDKIIIKKIIT